VNRVKRILVYFFGVSNLVAGVQFFWGGYGCELLPFDLFGVKLLGGGVQLDSVGAIRRGASGRYGGGVKLHQKPKPNQKPESETKTRPPGTRRNNQNPRNQNGHGGNGKPN